MSLLHPTPGEVMDRLGIIELKLEAYRKAGKHISILLSEERELLKFLSSFDVTTEIDSLRTSLFDYNRAIWQAEDGVRAWRSAEGHPKLCELALQIAKYNDYRSKKIREINRAFGIDGSEEKIYAKSA